MTHKGSFCKMMGNIFKFYSLLLLISSSLCIYTFFTNNTSKNENLVIFMVHLFVFINWLTFETLNRKLNEYLEK
ncbi:hypothetical protein [Silvanigrella sp.]|jgi:hypothetical protein|uniref:hypothetical protein n=1 Tax=Silvanigrella sp. TaxID=2024976 RepID=UPI0037CAD358